MTRSSVIASLSPARKPSKYRAVRTTLDGHSFASKREAMRYAALKLEEMAGHIRNLTLQPEFPIIINGVRVGKYVGDFAYFRDQNRIVEDVKGVRTPLYRFKKKCISALYNIDIVEVK